VHDTSARPNIHPAVPPALPPPPPAAGAARAPAKSPVDTALVRQLLAQRPIPSDKIVIRLVHPLKAETRYVVRITGATNLIGKKGDGDVGFSVPKPVVADTSRRTPRQPPPPPPTSKPPP